LDKMLRPACFPAGLNQAWFLRVKATILNI
jgi:hypothetical protein